MYHYEIDSALIKMPSVRKRGHGMKWTITYLVSVLIYLLHILRRINFLGRVRAFCCEFWESGNLKREPLAVGNVPVQHV